MKTALIVHGADGSPDENWFQWLRTELEKLGYEVFVPQFPTPENQTLQTWLTEFEKIKDNFNESSLFIGHSIGVAFILNILEMYERKINASFLVSGFIGNLNNPGFDEINQTIANKEFNWEKIKQNCKEFFLYHSKDDPYVPIEKAANLIKQLNPKQHIEENAGHFNTAAGYTEFPQLLQDIKSLTKDL